MVVLEDFVEFRISDSESGAPIELFLVEVILFLQIITLGDWKISFLYSLRHLQRVRHVIRLKKSMHFLKVQHYTITITSLPAKNP